jgi:exosome complex component MTR3
VTPSASGSAYLELESQLADPNSEKSSLSSLSTSGMKLTCTVHGPRPLPRSVPFSPTIILTTHVKYAPFASRQRRGYIRDASERDLAVHLETAIRGVIIGDRWPKSGVEVIITILEGEEDRWLGDECGGIRNISPNGAGPWGMMSVLSGCITVASAAIADAGIDCVDMISGGVAALVRDRQDAVEDTKHSGESPVTLVLDPLPSEHYEILAACVVGYLPSRDEITDLWVRGDIGVAMSKDVPKESSAYEYLADSAVQAALGAHHVLTAAAKESAETSLGQLDST